MFRPAWLLSLALSLISCKTRQPKTVPSFDRNTSRLSAEDMAILSNYRFTIPEEVTSSASLRGEGGFSLSRRISFTGDGIFKAKEEFGTLSVLIDGKAVRMTHERLQGGRLLGGQMKRPPRSFESLRSKGLNPGESVSDGLLRRPDILDGDPKISRDEVAIRRPDGVETAHVITHADLPDTRIVVSGPLFDRKMTVLHAKALEGEGATILPFRNSEGGVEWVIAVPARGSLSGNEPALRRILAHSIDTQLADLHIWNFHPSLNNVTQWLVSRRNKLEIQIKGGRFNEFTEIVDEPGFL